MKIAALKFSYTLLFISLVCSGQLMAQDNNGSEKGFAKKGDQTINVFYGYRIVNTIQDKLMQYVGFNLKSSHQGPIGIMYERFLDNNLAIGGEVMYLSNSFSFDYNDTAVTSRIYTVKLQTSTLHIRFRANYHLLQNENFDTYIFGSLGYISSKLTASTNDPSGIIKGSVRIPSAFGIKTGLGFRYFFNDHFGLNTELAIGTPILCGGLSFKF